MQANAIDILPGQGWDGSRLDTDPQRRIVADSMREYASVLARVQTDKKGLPTSASRRKNRVSVSRPIPRFSAAGEVRYPPPGMGADSDQTKLGSTDRHSTGAKRWDAFLAYASPDREVARTVYGILSRRCRVFWDVAAGLPGGIFSPRLEAAQRESRATVVLIRRSTYCAAHYLNEEVHHAIELFLAGSHPVYAVRLDREPAPYGLKSFSWLDGQDAESLEGAARALCDLLCPEPRFRPTEDIDAVAQLLDGLFPDYADAHALWLRLRDALEGPALARQRSERWRAALRAFRDGHARGLAPVLEAAWWASSDRRPLEAFLEIEAGER